MFTVRVETVFGSRWLIKAGMTLSLAIDAKEATTFPTLANAVDFALNAMRLPSVSYAIPVAV